MARRYAELPFRRIETLAGEEAQVDFGTGAVVIDVGINRIEVEVDGETKSKLTE